MYELTFDPYNELEISEPVRLVVYDNESKDFIIKEMIAEFEKKTILVEEKYRKERLKYKYQIKSLENKWLDTAYGYQKFHKINANDLLKMMDFNNLVEFDNQKLFEANEAEIEYCFRHVLLKTYAFLLGSPTQTKVNLLKSFLAKFPMKFLKENPVASHYYSFMSVLLAFIERNKFVTPSKTDSVKGIALINNICNEYFVNAEEGIGFRTGALLAQANVLSVYDRSQAYKIYQEVMELGKDFINNFLTIEAMTTYYQTITKKNNTYEIIEFKEYEPEETFQTNICFSADILYFKMFAVGWAQASLYFRNLTFNFGLITESIEEFYKIVKYFNEVLKSISDLTSIELSNNVRFFYIKSEIVNKTLYACARFYLASHLLEKYKGDIFITDIDQLVIGDLENYLSMVSKGELNIYHPKMRGYHYILPGRSHLAGNIFIRNCQEGKKYSQVLIDYVGMGLEEKFSWMLDQNATRYAAEKFVVGNLNDLGERVLKQFPNLKKSLKLAKTNTI